MKNTKLSYQDCGTAGWAVLIEGNASDIENRFNSFWNHGATSGELHWQTDVRAYFWTTEKKLLKAMTNASLFRLMNEAEETNCLKGCKGGAMPYAKEIAKNWLAQVEKTRDVLRYATNNEFFAMGTISAENLTDTDA